MKKNILITAIDQIGFEDKAEIYKVTLLHGGATGYLTVITERPFGLFAGYLDVPNSKFLYDQGISDFGEKILGFVLEIVDPENAEKAVANQVFPIYIGYSG